MLVLEGGSAVSVRPSGLACYVAGKLLFGKISVRRGDLISFLGGAAILPAWCTRGAGWGVREVRQIAASPIRTPPPR